MWEYLRDKLTSAGWWTVTGLIMAACWGVSYAFGENTLISLLNGAVNGFIGSFGVTLANKALEK